MQMSLVKGGGEMKSNFELQRGVMKFYNRKGQKTKRGNLNHKRGGMAIIQGVKYKKIFSNTIA